MKDKKEILDFVKDWLDSNIEDELQPEIKKEKSCKPQASSCKRLETNTIKK